MSSTSLQPGREPSVSNLSGGSEDPATEDMFLIDIEYRRVILLFENL